MGVTLLLDDAAARALLEDSKQALIKIDEQLKELRDKKRTQQEVIASLANQLGLDSGKQISRSRRRAPKGTNYKTLKTYLEARNGTGSLIADISEETGIPQSSVRAIVDKNPDDFVRSDDGRIRLKTVQLTKAP